VITVAPQNDICPHGRTYPMNAVAIRIRTIEVPENHVSLFFGDLFNRPRKMWVYIRIKNIDALFE